MQSNASYTVVETRAYLADATRILSEEERAAIVDAVAADPEIGAVMAGTGGVRKFRAALTGRGKRGGARVVYVFAAENTPIFLLAVFAKNEKANLTKAERNALAGMVRTLVQDYGE